MFVIRRRIPSQNRSQYAHWREYSREKHVWLRLMREVLPQRIPERRRVELVIRSFRTRLCDYANLVGGAKPIPDILRTLGYVWDDSPELFAATYVQAVVPAAAERTELEFITPIT